MVTNVALVKKNKVASLLGAYNQPVRVSISVALPLTRLQTNKCCMQSNIAIVASNFKTVNHSSCHASTLCIYIYMYMCVVNSYFSIGSCNASVHTYTFE